MSTLGDAAALLREAREDNRRREEATRHLQETDPVRHGLREERLRIAEAMVLLAAVESGVPLGCRALEARITGEGP